MGLSDERLVGDRRVVEFPWGEVQGPGLFRQQVRDSAQLLLNLNYYFVNTN